MRNLFFITPYSLILLLYLIKSIASASSRTFQYNVGQSTENLISKKHQESLCKNSSNNNPRCLQIKPQSNQINIGNVIYVTPLMKGNYPPPVQQAERLLEFEEPITIIAVSQQSTVEIIFDLRHVFNIPYEDREFTYKKDWDIAIGVNDQFSLDTWEDEISSSIVELPEIFEREDILKEDSHKFKLFAYHDLNLMIFIRILNLDFTNFRTLFLQTVSVNIKRPSRAEIGTDKIFPFVLNNPSTVNLPLNLPSMNDDGTYPMVIVSYIAANSSDPQIPQNITKQKIYSAFVNNDRFWKNMAQVTIPYIPYFSNCQTYGQYIFLHDLIEDSELCQLYLPEDTKPVEQIGFQQIPISDTCNQLEIECILDEGFVSSSALPKLYEQTILTELFYIVSDAVDLSDVTDKGQIFSRLELIPVISQNEVPQGYLPTSFNMRISYFQVDKYKKKIISAEMYFNSQVQVSTLQNQEYFKYNLTFTFHSMSHAELAIAFALQWPIYLLLSCIIGIFSISFILFYFLFYKFANFLSRRVVKNKSKYFFLSFNGILEILSEIKYFLSLYVPIIQGIGVSLLPNFIILFVPSVVMIGGFWSFSFLGCTAYTDDNICESSFFEKYLGDNITQQIRRGRLGGTLLIIGFYICIKMAAVFVPGKTEERVYHEIQNYTNKHQNKKYNLLSTLNYLSDRSILFLNESYDGNIWREKAWTRALFIFLTILILCVIILITYLSFSVYFGVNIWMFMFLLKINQIIIEECLKIYIENELLLGSLSCAMCLGAIDFFAYLFNAFVSLGISTFEKTYQVFAVEDISNYIFEKVSLFNLWIEKQLQANENEDNDDEEDEVEDNQDKQPDDGQNLTLNNEKDKEEDGNSEIVLTENFQESFGTQDEISIEGENIPTNRRKTFVKNDNKQRRKTVIKKSSFEKILDYQSETFDEKGEPQLFIDSDQFEKTFQNVFDKKFMRNEKKKQENEETVKIEETEEEINKQNKIYTDFCYNSFNLLGTVIALWIFFDPNQAFVKWGITKAGLLFYFLFNISSIPFQIFVDILLLKTVEQIHQVCIKDYVKSVRDRYRKRRCNWKADDPSDALKCLEPDLQYIDVWCFSPQYFFCISIFIAGIICVLQGVLMIIANSFNFLNDQKLFLIIVLWIGFCYLVEQGCYFVYNNTSIWKIKKPEEETKKAYQEPMKDNIIQHHPQHEDFVIIENKIQTSRLEIDYSPLIKQNNNEPQTPNLLNLDSNRQFKFQQSNLKNQNTFTQSRDNLLGFKSEELFPVNQRQSVNASRQSLFMTNLAKGKQRESSKKSNSNQFLSPCSKAQMSLVEDVHFLEDINYNEFLNEQAMLIKNNHYLEIFLKQEVQNVSQYDISVQNFILSNLNPSTIYNVPMIQKKDEIIQKMKMPNDNKYKSEVWLSYKTQFDKAYKYKEKKQKLIEKKMHFAQNEYKDEKFLKKFLILNKIWLRRNIKNMFDDLIRGGSTEELPELRNMIIDEFIGIYGELKQNAIITQIQVQPAQRKHITKQQAQEIMGTYIHGLLKYWSYRSKILEIAEKCIGGFMFKGQKQNCDFCKSTWGLQLQTIQNIEDLFNLYYKYECKRLDAYFNVVALFENDILIKDSKKYERDRFQIEVQNRILFSNMKYIEEDLEVDNILSNQENTKEESIHYYDEYASDLPPHEDGQYTKKQGIRQFYTQQSPLQRIKLDQVFDRKKFIERWQEFFFLNATFQTTCFDCNEKAHNQFIENIKEEKIKHQEMLMVQKSLIKQQLQQEKQRQKSLSKLDEQVELDNSKAGEEEEEFEEDSRNRSYSYTKKFNNNDDDIIQEENQEDDEDKQEIDMYDEDDFNSRNKIDQNMAIQEEEEGEQDNFPFRAKNQKLSYYSKQKKLNFQSKEQNLFGQESDLYQEQQQYDLGLFQQKQQDIKSLTDKQSSSKESSSSASSSSKNSKASKSSFSSIKQEQLSPIVSINNELENNQLQEDYFLDKNVEQQHKSFEKKGNKRNTSSISSSSSNSNTSSSQDSNASKSRSQISLQKQNSCEEQINQQQENQNMKINENVNSSNSNDSESDGSNRSKSSNSVDEKIKNNFESNLKQSKKSYKSTDSKTHPLPQEISNTLANSVLINESVKIVNEAELNLQFLPNQNFHGAHIRRISKHDTYKSHINNFLESPITFSQLSSKKLQGQQFSFVDYEKKNTSKLEIPEQNQQEDIPSISERQSRDEGSIFNPLHNQYTEEMYSQSVKQQNLKQSYKRKQFE